MKNLLELFNVMVVNSSAKYINTDFVEYGYVLDFTPTPEQTQVIINSPRTLNVNTLFSLEERENSDVFELISKQIMHYVEINVLDIPGLFELEVDNGQTVNLRFVKGVTQEEVQTLINDVVYRNAPIKDINVFVELLREFTNYDFDKIANNDLRVKLFDQSKHMFTSGDDAVRWIIQNYTNSDILIKSREVIAELTINKNQIPLKFLSLHEDVLASVFNRHKKIFLAIKTKKNRTVINRIARFSKASHVPLYTPISKTFIAKAFAGEISDIDKVLSNISVRDKFKYLNLLDWKLQQLDVDAFLIRNGKVHLESDRPVYSSEKIKNLVSQILVSLAGDLLYLHDVNILLDPNVDIGLPISRKQTLGNLPYGTTVTVDNSDISAGIHWRDEWGARDLDLSAIDRLGNRTGWGQYSGYGSSSITYSGDLVSAYNGAMEFMTSKDVEYGLFVNIYSGAVPSQADIVVGKKTAENWIDTPILQERIQLKSKGNIIGFVHGNKFIVYSARLNNKIISGYNPVIQRGFSEFWTVSRLLDALNITYDIEAKEGVDYDIDLSYNSFTIDKVENMFAATKVVP